MASDLKEAGGLTRLHVTAALEPGAHVAPEKGQAHYLLHVLRAEPGDRVFLFNGRDGEWQAEIAPAPRRSVAFHVLTSDSGAPQAPVPDLWLVFAPVKKTPSDYLVQKATELGVSRLQPVFTRRTIVARLNTDRLHANAVEAAERIGPAERAGDWRGGAAGQVAEHLGGQSPHLFLRRRRRRQAACRRRARQRLRWRPPRF